MFIYLPQKFTSRIFQLLGIAMLTGAKREWDNCFIENAHKITRILPDFI